MVDVVSSAFIDEFVWLRKRRTLVTLVVCAVSFICGLPLCMQGGIYVFTVLNDYAAGYCIIALAFIELAIVSYFYGVRQFIGDCQMMVGHQGYPYWSYWMISWSVISPAFLLVGQKLKKAFQLFFFDKFRLKRFVANLSPVAFTLCLR